MNNLTENEISNIEAFCKNKEMYDAVKKVILAGIYSHGTIQAGEKPDPLRNAAFGLAALSTNNPIPDEIMGQHIRGMWAGVNALENAFIELSNIKLKKEDKTLPTNKAI
jgi:hypothetical protein